MQPAEVRPQQSPSRIPAITSALIWSGIAIALVAWSAARLDAFDWWGRVAGNAPFPATYATVDHPFHVARAETLRQSLANGELLRWVANHQGGYPAEFYPFGFAGFEVTLWGLLLGSQPMMVVHKLAIYLTFILPFVGYLLLARRDRLPSGVAVIAFALHISVAGWWWSGGYRELVEWGLVSNVAAVSLLLIAMPLSDAFVAGRSTAAGGAAALLIAWAAYTNTRSLVAVVAVLGAILLVSAWELRGDPGEFWSQGKRTVLLILLAALMAAPQLGSLARFNDLYYFVQFQDYETLREYWHSSMQAASSLVIALALPGLLLALISGKRQARVVAVTTILYVAGTALLIVSNVISQLEPTRLMPFQRLLMIYLAAYGLYDIATRLGNRWTRRPALTSQTALFAATILVPFMFVVAPPGFIPVNDRSLYPVATTDQPAIADLEVAIQRADETAAAGTSMLVLGTVVGWHDGLWSPLWTERPLFYDDWLWYWQTEHQGDYDPLTSHSYTDDASTLTPGYLAEHGIGAVIVTGEARDAAAASPLLQQVRSGVWDVYRVIQPITIVTFSASNATESVIANQVLSASSSNAGGDVLVRRNWYPRWSSATGDVIHRADGYMSTSSGEAGDAIRLEYRVDTWDWLFRLACVAGLIASLIMIALPAGRDRLRPGVFSARRTG